MRLCTWPNFSLCHRTPARKFCVLGIVAVLTCILFSGKHRMRLCTWRNSWLSTRTPAWEFCLVGPVAVYATSYRAWLLILFLYTFPYTCLRTLYRTNRNHNREQIVWIELRTDNIVFEALRSWIQQQMIMMGNLLNHTRDKPIPCKCEPRTRKDRTNKKSNW